MMVVMEALTYADNIRCDPVGYGGHGMGIDGNLCVFNLFK